MIEKFGIWVIELWKKLFNLPNQHEITSKSNNPKIVEVNRLIVEGEDYDGDYWYSWGNYLLEDQLVNFDSSDWQDLIADFSNWNSLQLWIFTEMLILDNTNKLSSIDKSAIYGHIFTLVDNETANNLIIDLVILDNNLKKEKELLLSIKRRINDLKNSETQIQPNSLYISRLELIDKLLENNQTIN